MRGGGWGIDRAIAGARRLLRREHGNSLIEFGIVAPVLTILLLGMMDVMPLAVARTKLNQATQTSGDVAAAASQMQTSDVANVFAAATQVMYPLPTADLILRVSNVYSDGAGRAKVYWSCGQGTLAPLTPNSQITTTANGTAVSTLIYLYNTSSTHNGTNTSFVMVESAYAVGLHTGFIVKTRMTMIGPPICCRDNPRMSAFRGTAPTPTSRRCRPRRRSTPTRRRSARSPAVTRAEPTAPADCARWRRAAGARIMPPVRPPARLRPRRG